MQNCCTQPVHAVGEKIERELAAKARNVISRSGVAEENTTSTKNSGSPGTDDPKNFGRTIVRSTPTL